MLMTTVDHVALVDESERGKPAFVPSSQSHQRCVPSRRSHPANTNAYSASAARSTTRYRLREKRAHSALGHSPSASNPLELSRVNCCFVALRQ